MARLFWLQADKSMVEFAVDRDRLIVGRAERCDIRLNVSSVSSEHAVIRAVESEMNLSDMQSTNGTRVNGKRIKETHVLRHGDQIEFGGERLVYYNDGAVGTDARKLAATTVFADTGAMVVRTDSSPSPSAAIKEKWPGPERRELPRPPQPEHSGPKGFIVLLSGARAGTRFPLQKIVTTLGQSGMQVFEITLKDGAFWAQTGPGSSPPLVNGQATPERGLRLQSGDNIELVGARMRFEIDPH